jgi:hypothetical protein
MVSIVDIKIPSLRNAGESQVRRKPIQRIKTTLKPAIPKLFVPGRFDRKSSISNDSGWGVLHCTSIKIDHSVDERVVVEDRLDIENLR